MAKMKVVQCWDDGVITDGRLIDILRRHGAKATFNLNPGLMDPEKRGECGWRKQGGGVWNHNFGFGVGKFSLRDIPEVYAGFELASHCWRHENAGSVPDDQWIKSALDARRFLEDIVQKPCRGFAWPCGVSTQGTIDLLRENGFAYGRTTQNTYDVTDCAEPLALAFNSAKNGASAPKPPSNPRTYSAAEIAPSNDAAPQTPVSAFASRRDSSELISASQLPIFAFFSKKRRQTAKFTQTLTSTFVQTRVFSTRAAVVYRSALYRRDPFDARGKTPTLPNRRPTLRRKPPSNFLRRRFAATRRFAQPKNRDAKKSTSRLQYFIAVPNGSNG